jgi:integrase/recombinase XerD
MTAICIPHPVVQAVTPRITPTPPPQTQPFAIAETNEDLIELWLYGKSSNTCDGYRRDIRLFLNFIQNKPLQAVTLNDVQAFAHQLAARNYASETQRRRLVALKSLLTYGYDMEVLPRNVGKWIKLPKVKVTIAERILSEQQVMTILSLTVKQRDHALLRLLYATGCRVSEICALKWRDVQESTCGRGQVTLFGKGQRARTVVFSAATWQFVRDLKGAASADDFVFQSRTGKKLYRSQVTRILRSACDRAGITAKVTPHWFRHSHASTPWNEEPRSILSKPPWDTPVLQRQAFTCMSVPKNPARCI